MTAVMRFRSSAVYTFNAQQMFIYLMLASKLESGIPTSIGTMNHGTPASIGLKSKENPLYHETPRIQ
jgi:hypothetical protein